MAGKWTVAAICGGILCISLAVLIYTCFTAHQICNPKGRNGLHEGTASSEIESRFSESATTSRFTDTSIENSVTVTTSTRTSNILVKDSSSTSPTTVPSNVTLSYHPVTNTASNNYSSNQQILPTVNQNSSSVVVTKLSTVSHSPGSVWETKSSAIDSSKVISTSPPSASISAYNSSLVIISLPPPSSFSSSYKSTLGYVPIPYSFPDNRDTASTLENIETNNSSEDVKYSTIPSTATRGKDDTASTSRLISILTSGVSLDSSQTERTTVNSEQTTSEDLSTVSYPVEVSFSVELGDKIIHTPAKCPTGYKKFEGKCRPKWSKTDNIEDESDALSNM
ncbi:hypothetical protein C0J52_11585 [Blattella germanica]|nr:hypothetical protein C0J52_11585 [Blattella germanica]